MYLLQPEIKGNNVVDVGLDHLLRLGQEADLSLKKEKKTVGIRFRTPDLAFAPRPVGKILPVKTSLGPSTKSRVPRVLKMVASSDLIFRPSFS